MICQRDAPTIIDTVALGLLYSQSIHNDLLFDDRIFIICKKMTEDSSEGEDDSS